MVEVLEAIINTHFIRGVRNSATWLEKSDTFLVKAIETMYRNLMNLRPQFFLEDLVFFSGIKKSMMTTIRRITPPPSMVVLSCT
mmetsp:Transcript_28137/g.51249  ORF Transcript_28137/g.51249 Transcript_28137/m.51249 type:complete len:84 (+) Transcript_28137:809-1060(+)